MKIYLVKRGSYADEHYITATIDEKLATAIANKFNDPPYNEARLEVFGNAEIYLKSCFYVAFDLKGNLSTVRDESLDPDSYDCLLHDHKDGMSMHVVADSEKEAIKIASQRRMEYITHRTNRCILYPNGDIKNYKEQCGQFNNSCEEFRWDYCNSFSEYLCRQKAVVIPERDFTPIEYAQLVGLTVQLSNDMTAAEFDQCVSNHFNLRSYPLSESAHVAENDLKAVIVAFKDGKRLVQLPDKSPEKVSSF